MHFKTAETKAPAPAMFDPGRVGSPGEPTAAETLAAAVAAHWAPFHADRVAHVLEGFTRDDLLLVAAELLRHADWQGRRIDRLTGDVRDLVGSLRAVLEHGIAYHNHMTHAAARAAIAKAEGR